MSDFQPIDDKDNIWLRPRRKKVISVGDTYPWGSWICGILSVGVFLLIHATGGGGVGANQALAYATYPDAVEIWNGALWGPLTSTFVHVAPLHLIFNMMWLKLFGPAMERTFGTARFLTLVVLSGYLTSTAQLAFSDNAGIGFSGVNYALFGFLWMARRRIPDLETVVTDSIVKFMLAWLVIAPFITKAGLMPIGNASHNSGIILGILAGAVFVLHYKRALTLPALALTIVLLLIPPFYAPWTTTWMWYEGLHELQAGNYENAIKLYDRVLAREPDDKGAVKNRNIARDALKADRALETLKSNRTPDDDD